MGPGDDRSKTRIQMCLEAFINILGTHDVYDVVASSVEGVRLIMSHLEPDGNEHV